MILQIKDYFSKKVNGRTPRNRKKDLKLKIRQVGPVGYVILFFISVLTIKRFPVFGWPILGLYSLDFVLTGFFNKGIFRFLFMELEKYEYLLWRKVIKNKKMTFENRYKYIRKHKKKLIKKFLKKKGIQSNIEYVISRLIQQKGTNLAINTVCVSAIFLSISTLLFNFTDTILSFDQTIVLWNEIKSDPTRSSYLVFFGFFFAFLHLLRLIIVVSPFFLGLLYFKIYTLKLDKLITILDEIRLEKR